MRKFLVKLLCFWIPGRDCRRKIKADLMNWRTSIDIPVLLKLFFKKLRCPTVLVLETNNTHGEVVIGYAKYFRDLGYDVDVILNHFVEKEKPFCRVNDNKIKVYSLSNVGMRLFAKFKKVNDYKKIMITSSECYFYDPRENLYSARKLFEHVDEKKLLVVEHDIENIDLYDERKLLAERRLITLAKLSGVDTIAINPHYFGEVKKTNKNGMTNFIVVGGIEGKRKNHKLLSEAVDYLIDSGLDNFKITVVGKGNVEDLALNIRKYFDIKGRLNFLDMFVEMEKADFYLMLLDPENESHKRYITTGVTGSVQLIFGFGKPGIVNDIFADFYKFNSENALVYSNDDLREAMKKAVYMHEDKYCQMQKELIKLKDNVYRESLENLERIMKNED